MKENFVRIQRAGASGFEEGMNRKWKSNEDTNSEHKCCRKETAPGRAESWQNRVGKSLTASIDMRI